MKKVQIPSGVEIDCCDDHGVWLDNDELQKIIEHAQSNAQSGGPSMVEGLGRTLVESAVSGAGWGAGTGLATTLIRKLFG